MFIFQKLGSKRILRDRGTRGIAVVPRDSLVPMRYWGPGVWVQSRAIGWVPRDRKICSSNRRGEFRGRGKARGIRGFPRDRSGLE